MLPQPAMTLRAAALCSILQHAAAVADPVTVATGVVADLARFPERSAPATVEALDGPVLAAQIGARVLDITVKPGDVVAPEAALVRLDCADYRLGVAANEARLEALDAQVRLAQQKLERARRLAETKMTAEELVDERAADLARLEAERRARKVQLETARLAAERCVVRSPAKALVMARLASEGDLAQVGTPLLELVALETLEVVADVYAPDAARLEPNLEFTYVAAGTRQPVRLRTVVGAIDPAARTREVRLSLEPGANALPGSAGRLVWRDPRPHLPADTLVRRNGEFGVFVADGDVARFVAVPGAEVGRDVPVSLPPDTQIIREGHLGLTDGDAIVAESGS